MNNIHNIHELMAFLCGVNDLNLDNFEIEDIFYEQYEIDIDKFQVLIEDLLPLCTIAQSALTDTWYQGFGANGIWLIKQQID